MGDLLTQAVSNVNDEANSQTCRVFVICLLKRIINILTELPDGHSLFEAEAHALKRDQSGFSYALVLLERLDDECDDALSCGKVDVVTDAHHDDLHKATEHCLNLQCFRATLCRRLDRDL